MHASANGLASAARERERERTACSGSEDNTVTGLEAPLYTIFLYIIGLIPYLHFFTYMHKFSFKMVVSIHLKHEREKKHRSMKDIDVKSVSEKTVAHPRLLEF